MQSEKTSESTELTKTKINNVHIENNSESSFPGNVYLNAINVPNYDNLKGMDFSKKNQQSKLKKNKNISIWNIIKHKVDGPLNPSSLKKTLKPLNQYVKEENKILSPSSHFPFESQTNGAIKKKLHKFINEIS